MKATAHEQQGETVARREPDRPSDFSGPWFDSRTAAAYIPCKSIKAFYEWRKRHGIVPRANGSVAKADLDRVLNLRRRHRRRMHANSLANLRKRCG